MLNIADRGFTPHLASWLPSSVKTEMTPAGRTCRGTGRATAEELRQRTDVLRVHSGHRRPHPRRTGHFQSVCPHLTLLLHNYHYDNFNPEGRSHLDPCDLHLPRTYSCTRGLLMDRGPQLQQGQLCKRGATGPCELGRSALSLGCRGSVSGRRTNSSLRYKTAS